MNRIKRALEPLISMAVRKRGVFLTCLLTLCLLLGATSCLYPEETDSAVDSDGDGWTNAQEKIVGTDPKNVDTDDDGYWDPHDPNPLDPNIPVEEGLPKPTPEPTDITTPEPAPTITPTTPSTSTVTEGVSQEVVAEEFHRVQIAVKVMMKNNNLTELAHPVRVPTNDMHRFPYASTRHGTAGVGYVLYLHDFDGNGSYDINYINCSTTKGTYLCDEYGNVTQVTTGEE